MAWNHKSRILAMAIAIQPTPGVFNAPSAPDDLIAVGTVTNGKTGETFPMQLLVAATKLSLQLNQTFAYCLFSFSECPKTDFQNVHGF